MKTLMKQLQWAAVTALFTASVWAAAPAVEQNVDNTGGISVNTQMPNTGELGQGASASISASGAVGSVSISGNGGGFVYSTDGSGANGFASVTQTIDNTGNIQNGVSAASTIEIGDSAVAPPTSADLGQGAVASIGATGATASVSVSGNGASALGEVVNLGAVTQTTTNVGEVTNGATGAGNNSITAANLVGDGSAAAISAGGASSSVGLSFNNSELDGELGSNNFVVGGVTQTSDNVDGTTGPDIANYGTIELGTHSGDGASASISATGASASVSLSSINSSWDANSTSSFAGATQTATNGATGISGTITNEGTLSITSGGITGVGGSASISASGSVAAVGVSSIGASAPSPIVMAGAIDQTSTNYMTVSNTGTVDLGGGGLAQGAGASAGATGAAASVSFRTITPPAP